MMLARLASLNPKVVDADVHIAAVSMGQPDEAAEFCGERAPGVLCLSDPEQRAYRAYGLGKGGWMELMGPGVWLPGVEAAVGGHITGAPVGDVSQMPGTFIIGQDGRVTYAYYSKNIGDHPSERQLLTALQAALDEVNASG